MSNSQPPNKEIYIGLMSGTSMDAIDTIVVDFSSSQPKVLAYEEFPHPSSLKKDIRGLGPQSTIASVTKFDILLGKAFAGAVAQILLKSGLNAKDIKAIGSHGQTILHLPDATQPRTLQIGDPNVIAYHTHIDCVADFRRMDIAAGGQGAPLAPASHDFLFRSTEQNRVILNIGGIANLSVLPANPAQNILGFDTGPGNGLLDDWIQTHRSLEFDRDSHWALQGNCNELLLNKLLSFDYFKQSIPKSTGRDQFNLNWLNSQIQQLGLTLDPVDVQSTLLELSCITIANAINRESNSNYGVFCCGGGAQNPIMLNKIKTLLPHHQVAPTTLLGVDPNAVEALCFAWLAKQTVEGRSGNAPSVTGAKSLAVLGAIYSSC